MSPAESIAQEVHRAREARHPNVNSLEAQLPRVPEFLAERTRRKGAKPSDHAPLVAALTSP